VAAMIVREMDLYGIGGREAVRRVIDDPRLYKIRGLGIVVNAH
jgi:hypothetical protein